MSNMKRKEFIRNAALTAAGSIVIPYILPSGRLFAATGSRKANHVVFCLFAGGVADSKSPPPKGFIAIFLI